MRVKRNENFTLEQDDENRVWLKCSRCGEALYHPVKDAEPPISALAGAIEAHFALEHGMRFEYKNCSDPDCELSHDRFDISPPGGDHGAQGGRPG